MQWEQLLTPGNANKFMARFEEKHIYSYIKDKVELYLRYTDDIFFIWKVTEEQLNIFLMELIACILPLKLIKNIQNQKQNSLSF